MVQSKKLIKHKKIDHCFLGIQTFKSDIFEKAGHSVYFLDQQHSSNIIVLNNHKPNFFKADGMITNQNHILGLKTADCLPIIFYSRKKNYIAAIHAGWRGLLYGIIPNTINTLINLGNNSTDIICAIGPHVGDCCYQVSKELVNKFTRLKKSTNKIFRLENNRYYLKLADIAQVQMNDLSIPIGNIDNIAVCTYCDKDYHSYRRDGNSTGKNISWIKFI